VGYLPPIGGFELLAQPRTVNTGIVIATGDYGSQFVMQAHGRITQDGWDEENPYRDPAWSNLDKLLGDMAADD
jgi:hypothetical protein